MTYQGAKYVGKKIPQVNIDSSETFVDCWFYLNNSVYF